MKQFTDAVQTAQLMQLGFPSPKGVSKLSLDWDMDTVPTFNYSIGELIEMLPPYIKYNGRAVGISKNYYSLTIRRNEVMYCDPYMDWIEEQCKDHDELIDNLLDMIIKLKEEKLI